MRNTILFRITVIVITLLVNSCGARKSETEKKHTETKTDYTGIFRNSGNSSEFLKTDISYQSQFKSFLFDKSKIDAYEFTFEPEDLTKPATYTDPSGQKHVVENGKLTSKKTHKDIDRNSGNSGNSDATEKAVITKKASQNNTASIKINDQATSDEWNKKTNREAWSAWNLLWILLPVFLILAAWKLYKNYKQKNPIL